ncbi:MAG: hypothetical protein SFV19_03910 [Rhodospirillaceae bacterium]|nr:hypothetical protein [Rhodospirillaceae bacterium]
MRKIIGAIIGMTAVLVVGVEALAHAQYRVIGTIIQRQGVKFEVKTRDGRIAYLHLDENTEITRDQAKVSDSELEVGRFVVINAYGDDYSDMLAMDVRLVPPPAVTPAK